MSARDAHLADLLCHHGDDEAGHPLDPACPVQVKAATRVGWPVVPAYGADYGATLRFTATGTCPACGRPGVRVARVVRKGAAFDLTPDAVHRVPLGVELALAAHKRPGRGAPACDGAGRPPAETRFTPSPLIGEWLAEHGPESVR